MNVKGSEDETEGITEGILRTQRQPLNDHNTLRTQPLNDQPGGLNRVNPKDVANDQD